MKTLYVEQPKSQKYLHLFMGALFILQGIFNLLKEGYGFSFGFGVFLCVFGCLNCLRAFSILKPTSVNVPKIYLGENDITLFKGLLFGKPKTFSLEDIKLLQLKPETLDIMLKEYDITHSFPYEGVNKRELIDSISEYAEQMDIPVERVSYR